MSQSKTARASVRAGQGGAGVGHHCTVKLMRGISAKTRIVSDKWGTCKRIIGK